MGNNCKLVCMDCNQDYLLGRVYRYNKEQINKKLPEDTLHKLKLAVKRFEMSLQKIELFGEEYYFDGFEEELDFLEEHEGHNVWLIDDYFGGVKNTK